MSIRILCRSLKSRYTPTIDVALWEEFERDSPAPVRWIVTSADRDDHEWNYDSLEKALYHFDQLKEARLNRSRSRYEAVKAAKAEEWTKP